MPTSETRTLLSLHNIDKQFGAVKAVHDVDFTVAPGQVVALLGDNGAGKGKVGGCSDRTHISPFAWNV